MTRKKIHSVTSSPKSFKILRINPDPFGCFFAGHDPQKNTFCDVITKIIHDMYNELSSRAIILGLRAGCPFC
jgi:hypothetical protein